jgi:hypothetical protein
MIGRGGPRGPPVFLGRAPNGGIVPEGCRNRHLSVFVARRHGRASTHDGEMTMKKYVIERDLPGVGAMNADQLKGAAATSNAALAKLSPRVQWLQSFVTPDKTFCIYLAENEDAVREHAKISGFPANKITEVTGMIDPSTGG